MKKASYPKLRLALRLRFLTALVAGGMSATLFAHGDLHLQIQVVTEEISAAPSAALYLKRGTLHHEHGEYARALADYDQADRLEPASPAVAFARARTLFQTGRYVAAQGLLDGYLEQKPRHADAFFLRARVLCALGQYGAAVADFDRSLALTPEPLPECFLERAAALVAEGRPDAALEGLEAGLRRRGDIITLQSAALEVELKFGRTAAALVRIDHILDRMPRKESWLARRGEILETAGRTAEAREDFQQALLLIERLPAQHRAAKSIRDLESQLREKLSS